MSRAKTSGPILTICTSYDVPLHKEVPFGGRDVSAPHLGGKIPKKNLHFWVNRHFQVKLVNQHLHIIETTTPIPT